MKNPQITRSFFIGSVQFSAAFICLGLMYVFGVEEKTIFEKSLGFFSGGAIGGLLGLLAFLFIGTIGWVAGALYGAIGVFSLIAGGILGGMGLGSIVDIIRNPDDYNFNLIVIFIGVVVIAILWMLMPKYAGKYYDNNYEEIRERAKMLFRKFFRNSSEDG